METAKHIIVVLALSLLVTGTAISKESQISNTRQASCVVQIITQEDILPLDAGDINSLVRSSAVFGKAVSEVLEHAPDNILNGPKVTGRHTGNEITYNFELNVRLPSAVKPAANEFLNALIDNLRTSLNRVLDAYRVQIHEQLRDAQNQYEAAESQLDEALKSLESKQSQNKYVITFSDLSEADKKVYKQLDQEVSLSGLNPQIPLSEVLGMMSKSVEPALQIQPDWRDLADNADINPTTATEMGPLSSVKLGKALDILLKNLSSDLATINYTVKGGVIIITTEENLITTVYDVSGLISPSQSISSIKNAIEKTIEPDSWYDMDDTGEGKIEIIVGNQLSIRQTPEIQQKIQTFLDSIPIEKTAEPEQTAPQSVLFDQRRSLTTQKHQLEMDVASLTARQKAIEERVKTIGSQSTSKIKDDPVIKELEQIINNQTQHMEQIKLEIEHNVLPRKDLLDEEDKLSRLKIELAKRREELGNTAGAEQLTTLNNDLSTTMIDLAGKEAELSEIEKQLSSIASQMKAASIVDPNVLKIRHAREAFQEAADRLNELKTKEANLSSSGGPQVIAIGIN